MTKVTHNINTSRHNWCNTDASQYYENLPIKEFESIACAAGIETGCDVDLVYPKLKNVRSILEIGSGYGRVLQCLIDKGYTGHLFSIERSKQLAHYLKKRFKQRVHLYPIDVNACSFNKKVDAVLWLWSGISEHPKNQQFTLLTRFAQCLTPSGFIVLDTISPDNKAKNAEYTHNQSWVLHSNYGTVHGYSPNEQEVCHYGKTLGFDVSIIPYKTNTGRNRQLYIFENRI